MVSALDAESSRASPAARRLSSLLSIGPAGCRRGAWPARRSHVASVGAALRRAAAVDRDRPLLFPHVWEHHYGKIAAVWSALVIVPLAVAYGRLGRARKACCTRCCSNTCPSSSCSSRCSPSPAASSSAATSTARRWPTRRCSLIGALPRQRRRHHRRLDDPDPPAHPRQRQPPPTTRMSSSSSSSSSPTSAAR